MPCIEMTAQIKLPLQPALLPRAKHIDLRCNYVLSKSASLLWLLIGGCRRWCVMYTQEVAIALSEGGGVYLLR